MQKFCVLISILLLSLGVADAQPWKKKVKIPGAQAKASKACPGLEGARCAPGLAYPIYFNQAPIIAEKVDGLPIYIDVVGTRVPRPIGRSRPMKCSESDAGPFTREDIDASSYVSDMDYREVLSRSWGARLEASLIEAVENAELNASDEEDAKAAIAATIKNQRRIERKINVRVIVARLNDAAQSRLRAGTDPAMSVCRSLIRDGFTNDNYDFIDAVTVFEVERVSLSDEIQRGIEADLRAKFSELEIPYDAKVEASFSSVLNSETTSSLENAFFVWAATVMPEKDLDIGPINSGAISRTSFERTEGESGEICSSTIKPRLKLADGHYLGFTATETGEDNDPTTGWASLGIYPNQFKTDGEAIIAELPRVESNRAQRSEFELLGSKYGIWAPRIDSCSISYEIALIAL